MLKVPALFFSLVLIAETMAQRTVSGKVTDATTGAAIPGCSVFISGSSKGTVSGADGVFELAGVPAGKNDLVVSSVGYETFVASYNDSQLPLALTIKLRTKAKELQNVVLEPYVEEGWDRWGKVFTDNFIGLTPNAAKCRIRNTKAIKFRYYKKSNRLIALCDEPLLIENKALGYLLKYQLEGFEVDFGQRTTFYLGYPLYEDENDGKGKSAAARREEKREEVYHGSIMHFMRAFYNNQLIEEGFEIRRMQRIPNAEKERVRALYKKNLQTSIGNGTVIRVGPGSVPGSYPADSAAYYRQVLQQPDHKDIYGTSLLTADSILVNHDKGYKGIWFENYIAVTYKKGLEDPAYVQGQLPARKPWHPRSLVILLEGEPVVLDENGNYFDPQHFFTSGYWGWSEKIANSLPIDYWPKEHPGK